MELAARGDAVHVLVRDEWSARMCRRLGVPALAAGDVVASMAWAGALREDEAGRLGLAFSDPGRWRR
jgi:hypothetical protein